MIARIAVIGTLLLAGAPGPYLGARQPSPPAATIAAVEWLAGTWTGSNGPLTFEERWTPAAGGVMLAVSRTVRGKGLSAFEFLRIVERGGSLVYIAQPGGRPPTDFTATAIAPDGVTFENATHDYPKMIRYSKRADGTLEAAVSDGAERVERFVFTRTP